MFRPFKRTRKIWSTPETLLFAVSVASAIKTSVDEKPPSGAFAGS